MIFLVLLVEGDAGQTVVAVAHKVEDGTTHAVVVDVGFDAFDGVEGRCLALVNVAVGLGGIVDFVGTEVVLAGHDVGVDAVVGHGVVGHDDKGRNI